MYDEVEKMPQEYYGKEYKKKKGAEILLRMWTQNEINWILKLRSQGYTTKQIAESVGRQVPAVELKLKRLTKKDNTYNLDHLEQKEKGNEEFNNYIKPASVCDVFCGVRSVWRNIYKIPHVRTNDIDVNIDADYHAEAMRFLCLMYFLYKEFDVVDLDPFGSAAECLDLAIILSKKGLIVTLGEMGHKRFKRLDYVRRVYNINTLEEFTTENIIAAIQAIGRKYKKDLKVFRCDNYKQISRVWFEVQPMKITEQWKNYK